MAEETQPTGPQEVVDYMTGGTMYRQKVSGGPDYFFLLYKLPGTGERFVYYEFNLEEAKTYFGGSLDGAKIRSRDPGFLQRKQVQGTYIHAGFAAETYAQTEGESFRDRYDRTVRARTQDALSGPNRGLIQGLIKDPIVQDTMFIAYDKGWDSGQILEDLHRQGQETVVARYPNLPDMMNLTGQDAAQTVAVIRNYEQSVTDAFVSRGFDPPTTQEIGEMMTSRKDLNYINSTLDNIVLFRRNPQLFDHLSQVLAVTNPQLANELNFLEDEDAILDFLEGGNTTLEHEYEMARLSHTVEAQGLQDYLEAHEVVDLYGRIAGTDIMQRWGGNLAYPLQNAARSILNLRHDINLKRYGLNPDDIIDLSVGLRPKSGVNPQDLRETMSRVLEEAERATEDRAQPLYRFDDNGVPQAISLRKIRQEI